MRAEGRTARIPPESDGISDVMVFQKCKNGALGRVSGEPIDSYAGHFPRQEDFCNGSAICEMHDSSAQAAPEIIVVVLRVLIMSSADGKVCRVDSLPHHRLLEK